MRTRIMVAFSFATAALALTLAAGSGAVSAAEAPDPIIVYSGTATTTLLSSGTATSFPIGVTVDCTELPCVARATVPGFDEPFAGPLPLDADGQASGVHVATGDVCADTFIGGGPTSFAVTATTAAGTQESTGSAETPCPDGDTTYLPTTTTFTATYVSGDVCFLTGDCPTATPSASPVPISAPAGLSGSAATPGTLSTLPTVAQAATPANAIWAAALTVVLALLIAFPSHLLTEATGRGAERLGAWWESIRGRASAVSSGPRVTHRLAGWPAAVVGIVLAALISSFVDPDFGATPQGLRIFASVLLSLAIDVVIGWIVVIAIMRRMRPDAPATVRVVPGTLLVVAIAVLFTRLTGFAPGIIFGLVAGVTFGVALATAERARVVLLGLGWSFALALAAWLGYSLLPTAVGATPFGVFLLETLSAIAIGGIAALPIALIPLRGLAGHEVFRWNRWVWGAAYAVGLLGFFFVLMPVPYSWETVGVSIWVWVGAYFGYAVGAVGLWLGFARPWEKPAVEAS